MSPLKSFTFLVSNPTKSKTVMTFVRSLFCYGNYYKPFFMKKMWPKSYKPDRINDRKTPKTSANMPTKNITAIPQNHITVRPFINFLFLIKTITIETVFPAKSGFNS